jgi:hypothetical protein
MHDALSRLVETLAPLGVAVALMSAVVLIGSAVHRRLERWRTGAGSAAALLAVVVWLGIGVAIGISSCSPSRHGWDDPDDSRWECIGPPAQAC